MVYAWYIWNKDYKGSAVIDWIDNLPPIIVWAGDFYNSGNVVREGLGMFLTDFDVKNA